MNGIIDARCCYFCKHKESIMYDNHRCTEWGVPVDLVNVCGLFDRKDVYRKILSDKINMHMEE